MIRTVIYKYCIYDKGQQREQLFDLKNDPVEMINLVDDKKFKSILKSNRKLITKWADSAKDKFISIGS